MDGILSQILHDNTHRRTVNGASASQGFTLNLPTNISLGNGRNIGMPISLGGSIGNSGLSINASVGVDFVWVGVNTSASYRFNQQELVGIDMRSMGRYLNTRAGAGVGVPLSPWESLRLYSFAQVRDGNETIYTESGVHMRMGVVYAVAFVAYILYALYNGMDVKTALEPLLDFWGRLGRPLPCPT